MLEIAEVNEFLEGKYIDIKNQFWRNNDATYVAMSEEIVNKTVHTFSELFKKIGEVLKVYQCQVGQITVSVIRQSVWEEKQRAIIEVFDSFEINKKLIYSEDMDVSWIFSNWSRYKYDLEEEIKNQGLSRIIKEPYICWMMEKSIKELIFALVCAVRPVLLDADELDNYDCLQYMDGFHITVGEYMDWQNVVFLIPTKIDIDDEDEKALRYQRVEDMSYGGINFLDKDFMGAKFINCSFQNCQFDRANFKDARFVNCRFRNVIMRNGSLENVGFDRCSLVDLDVSSMNMEDSYQNDCYFENVNVGD